MSEASILYAVDKGIATVTLNRPERLNALDQAMREDPIATLKVAERDPQVHVIVLKGNGRAFCAGWDLHDMAHQDIDPLAIGPRQDAMLIVAAAALWEQIWTLQKPIIAQVHGYCVGSGFEIALYSDITIAAEDAQFCYPSIRNGTGLPDTNAALYHAGLQWAKLLLLTGDFIDGATAARIGLVLEAVPAAALEATVNELAARIATVRVDLLAASKGILNKAIDLMGRPLLQHMNAQSSAIARANPWVSEFGAIVRNQGLHAAVSWREKRRRVEGREVTG